MRRWRSAPYLSVPIPKKTVRFFKWQVSYGRFRIASNAPLMTANLKLKSPFGKPPAPPASIALTPQTTTQGATVPISLYREISADLHTTRTELNQLKTEHQSLVQHHQQLRLEIERIVQTSLHLRQISDAHAGTTAIALEIFDQPSAAPALPDDRMQRLGPSSDKQALDKQVIEQDSKSLGKAQIESSAEVSTWWLIAVICLIVLSAFGTGFILVRPLLPSR
jgi:hypothetical protein